MKLLSSFFNYFLLFVFVYFLPIQVFAATIVYEITKGVVAYQVSVKGEVFFEKNLTIEYKGGQLVFSSNPDGTGATYADDAVIMTFKKQGTSVIKTFKHEYESSCRDLRSLPPKDLTSYLSGEGTYDINVKIKDECGYWAASSAMYLVNINAPEPSVSPTPTPPEPFLDLPWNYDCKQAIDEELNEECEEVKPIKNFDFSAIQINSHFDHEYPFLCCGLLYSLDESVIVSYKGEETRQGYTLHDGYDYGTPAYVEAGDPVLAAASGVATFIHKNNSGGGGHVIKIDHGNGYQTIYEHIKLDEHIVVNNEADKVRVQGRQRIGSVGYDGNCWVEDRYGNKIHNTPDCAHIHFGIVQDKEFINGQSDPADFSDNLPDGLTDPYGWQPTKEEGKKDEDPWEELVFTYKGEERKGNKSHYLWMKKLSGVIETVTDAGGEYSVGDVGIVVQPGTFNTPVTLEAAQTSSAKANHDIWSIGPVVDITVKNILDDIVTLLTKPIQIWWFPFDKAELSRFKQGTFYLYSSKDRINWTQEQEVDPFTPGNIAASASHLTYFAIMGERKDMIPPTTSAELTGEKGINNWFRSDVDLSLYASDSADMDPAGIKYMNYKINDNEWQLYSGQPITFSDEGHYFIDYYSSDKDGNIESVHTLEFDIDKTNPVANIEVNPKSIWPPNGKMIDVKVTGESSDINIVDTKFKVLDEYGEVEPEITAFGQTIQLQASRGGNDKDGRIYTIQVIASDLAGNTVIAEDTLVVPHDKGK